jgi:hypothetical protein
VVRTALNVNISRWRRRREVPVADPGRVADLPAAEIAAGSPVDPRIMAALMRLPARQRQVVALRLFLDLDTGRAAEAQLAAWTVTRQADGHVYVSIRQLRNLTGLAGALRADGVPAYVAFAGPVPAWCAVYPASKSQLRAIYQFHPGNGSTVLVIDPPAIPRGTGLFILDVPASHLPAGSANGTEFAVIAGRAVHIGLVHASQQCPVAEPAG